jgi:hypothetical protein
MAEFSARAPVCVIAPDEIERMLAEHRLYIETEYHEGHRATDLDPNDAPLHRLRQAGVWFARKGDIARWTLEREGIAAKNS